MSLYRPAHFNMLSIFNTFIIHIKGKILWLTSGIIISMCSASLSAEQVRARDLGIVTGIMKPGTFNAITDVPGVKVGQVTLISGDNIRTGVTAILPHSDNLFQNKVPAGLSVANGFGKMMGTTQIIELGEIETPVVLTNTLSVPQAADAVIGWTLKQPGNETVRSVNAVIGETNDGGLNNIRARVVTVDHVLTAIENAEDGPVTEGNVGAGTGTIAFGWKGGIGTSSRKLPASLGGYTVGVLVQSNYGGVLQIAGIPFGTLSGQYYLKDQLDKGDADGSIMIVVATDAPLSDRNLKRLANRAFAGLARTGASFTNGSGDYALAFSTAEDVRRTVDKRRRLATYTELANDSISPLFQAVIEATEEAIYNSLLMTETVNSVNPHTGQKVTVEALPVAELKKQLAGAQLRQQ